MKYSGSFTALITPFKEDGSVDLDGLRENVQFQLSNGISGVVPLGTTGESPTIRDDERAEIIKVVVKSVNKRIPVIVGTGTNSTKATIELTEQAKSLGADAVLIVTPYYNKPTQEGIFRHFKAVASRVDIPIIVYNIKGRTGVNIETATLKRLGEITNIVGVKEASGDLSQIKDVLEQLPKDFSVLSGDDNMTLELMKLGGSGVISVISNLVPKEVAQLCENAAQGNWEEAQALNDKLSPLFKAAFIETNPIPIKAAMELVGMPSGPLRLPLCELLPQNLDSLKLTLTQMGILK